MCDRLRHVVVDEADLLLGGGFARALWQVLDVMRDGDKERRIEALCREVGSSPARFHGLPYNIRKQALDGEQTDAFVGSPDMPGMHEVVSRPWMVSRLMHSLAAPTCLPYNIRKQALDGEQTDAFVGSPDMPGKHEVWSRPWMVSRLMHSLAAPTCLACMRW